jgi:hypothetical protein
MQPATRIAISLFITVAVATAARAQAPGAASRPGTVVITGLLKTVDGTPAADVRVSALVAPPEAVRPAEGIRAQDGIQYYLAPPPVRTVLTDKDGRYRITNLPPGRYLVAAGLPGQDTYYPDAVDAHGAKVLTLAADSTGSADFALVAPLAGRISGRVVPPPEPNVQENAILSGVFLTELVEAPVRPDGTFEFGRVPEGTYLVDLFPTVPGLKSVLFDVDRNDVSNLQLARPKLYTVSGRFNVARGPLPWALFAFYTDTSYAAADIKDDGTFTVKLHSATHFPDLGGMPSDYEMTRVRIGNRDVSKGLVVADRDISGLVVDVAAPANLPRLRGRVTGLPANRLSSLRVEINGPIFGVLQAPVRGDGSFVFENITPGAYWLKIPQAPQLEPIYIAVDWDGADVTVAVPPR